MSSDWSGRRVLVTGAGGFIGSHLAGRLVQAGADARCLLRYTSGRDHGLLRYEPEALEAAELVFGDLRDPDAVARALAGCDLVFHLGAHVSIPYSYEAPREVVETNVLGTLNVLAAAVASGARVVCTSTSEVYGTPEQVPITERHPLRPQSPYAASKVGADALADSFRRSFGLDVGIVRPFNTYGPRQSARAVIPTLLVQALAADEVRLGALHPVRDFTFVDDTVEGILRFGASADASGRTVQLGSGEAVSIGDLVELAADVVGRSLAVTSDEERLRPPDSEVDALVSDPAAARELLGWQPQVGLREGLERTARWISEHLDDYPAPSVYAR